MQFVFKPISICLYLKINHFTTLSPSPQGYLGPDCIPGKEYQLRGRQPLHYLDVALVLGTQQVLIHAGWLAGQTDGNLSRVLGCQVQGLSWGLLSSSYLFLLGARSPEDFLHALARGHPS